MIACTEKNEAGYGMFSNSICVCIAACCHDQGHGKGVRMGQWLGSLFTTVTSIQRETHPRHGQTSKKRNSEGNKHKKGNNEILLIQIVNVSLLGLSVKRLLETLNSIRLCLGILDSLRVRPRAKCVPSACHRSRTPGVCSSRPWRSAPTDRTPTPGPSSAPSSELQCPAPFRTEKTRDTAIASTAPSKACHSGCLCTAFELAPLKQTFEPRL